MAMGPVELRVIAFPGNHFRGEVIPALAELVEKEIVRVIDILFVYKAEDGAMSIFELRDLEDEEYQKFAPLVSEVTGMVSESDVAELSAELPDNSSEVLLLFEEVWSERFKRAVLAADGKLVMSGTVAPEIIEDLMAVESDD